MRSGLRSQLKNQSTVVDVREVQKEIDGYTGASMDNSMSKTIDVNSKKFNIGSLNSSREAICTVGSNTNVGSPSTYMMNA